MNTFLNAVHVVTAVLLVGPLVVAPFAARWLIGLRNADGVRLAANLVALFGVGIVLVAGFGVATLFSSDEWTPTTPWVLIAATLFVVALGLVWGYAVPALRTAASLVSEEVAAATEAVEAPEAVGAPAAVGQNAEKLTDVDLATEGEGGPTPTTAPAPDPADEQRRRYRLESISARVTGAGWLLVVTFGAITVLMTVRPFG